jgi:hypothetical protein
MMGMVLLGNCLQCGAIIYTYDVYPVDTFHINCNCLGTVMLAMGVPHINQLAMPFEDSYDEGADNVS